MQERIYQAIKAVVGDVPFVVERPRDLGHGDYATNAALVAKLDAHELASKLNVDGVARVEVVGKFVNFFLDHNQLLPQDRPVPQTNAGKTIMVEYTDPNPFKEFHIGHLMSNAIGESVARLFESTGAKVLRANYQGDVGPHVAKALWGKMQKPELTWGEAYVYGNTEYEAHKSEIDSINAKVYDRSDAHINALYNEGRAESLAHFEELYKKLGTSFEHYFFESSTSANGLVLVKAHPDIFVESEDAVVYHGSHTRVFITSQGLPTYETKDLGLLELKQETAHVAESITVTANEQKDYFAVVLEAARKLPEIADFAGKTKHVTHGMMRFAEGKMSSRKGNVITGESLVTELTELSKAKMQERAVNNADLVAQQVAVGAIKYAILRQGRSKDIIFDPEASLSLEGDSGPYLQYALVRARSLLREAAKANVEANTSDAPEPTVIERLLVHYPEVVARAAKELEPHYVTTYLTELAGSFNSWYAQNRVIGGAHPHYGVLLVGAVEQTLAHGLSVLGIPAPEEM